MLVRSVLNFNTLVIKTSPKRRAQHFPPKQLWKTGKEEKGPPGSPHSSQKGQEGGGAQREGQKPHPPSVSRPFLESAPRKHWTTWTAQVDGATLQS